MVKYPNIKVRLTGENGNAFMILGIAIKAAKRSGLSKDEIKEYTKEATSGDYDNLLRTTMTWFDVE